MTKTFDGGVSLLSVALAEGVRQDVVSRVSELEVFRVTTKHRKEGNAWTVLVPARSMEEVVRVLRESDWYMPEYEDIVKIKRTKAKALVIDGEENLDEMVVNAVG